MNTKMAPTPSNGHGHGHGLNGSGGGFLKKKKLGYNYMANWELVMMDDWDDDNFCINKVFLCSYIRIIILDILNLCNYK